MMFDKQEYNKQYYQQKREQFKQYYQQNREQILEQKKQYYQSLKRRVITHYTNGKLSCGCSGCTENQIEFLTVDHINEDGAEHRKTIPSGAHIFRWLIKNNFPPDFQILCYNCNCARSFASDDGLCPHEKLIGQMLCKEDVRG